METDQELVNILKEIFKNFNQNCSLELNIIYSGSGDNCDSFNIFEKKESGVVVKHSESNLYLLCEDMINIMDEGYENGDGGGGEVNLQYQSDGSLVKTRIQTYMNEEEYVKLKKIIIQNKDDEIFKKVYTFFQQLKKSNQSLPKNIKFVEIPEDGEFWMKDDGSYSLGISIEDIKMLQLVNEFTLYCRKNYSHHGDDAQEFTIVIDLDSPEKSFTFEYDESSKTVDMINKDEEISLI